MASLTIDNGLLTTTLYSIGKELREQNDYPLPFIEQAESIHGKGKPEEEGGAKIVRQVNFGRHSETQQLSTGYEAIDWTVSDVGTPAQDDWGMWLQPVVLSEREALLNRGKAKIIDMWEARSKAAFRELKERFHKRLWGQSVKSFSDLNTLNGSDYADGFIEAAAAGAQTHTVHGLAKSAYQSSLGWQNQYVNMADSFSTNGLIMLDQLTIRIQSIKGAAEKIRIYSSTSAFGHLKRAVRSNEQYVDMKELDAGRLALAWNGRPVILNRDMPAAGTTTTADPWSFAFIDHEEVFFLAQKGEYFRTSEVKELDSYRVRAGYFALMGQLMTQFMGSSGIAINGDAW